MRRSSPGCVPETSAELPISVWASATCARRERTLDVDIAYIAGADIGGRFVVVDDIADLVEEPQPLPAGAARSEEVERPVE